VISFTDLQGVMTREFNFQEPLLRNYTDLRANASFRISLFNTFVIWIMNFIPQIVLALALAAWFTNTRLKIKAVGAFKILFYMPNIITAASIAILFSAFFGAPVGPLNDVLVRAGTSLYNSFGTSLFFPTESFHFFRDAWISRGVVAFIQFWMWYGVTMIILIAGIMGINPTLFEAAAIDGATSNQTFFRITLPSLRPIVLYVLVTSLIGGLQMFDIPRLLVDRSGPDNATLTTSVFIFNQAFLGSYRFNLAAAASMILFLIIAVLSAILFFIMRDKDAAKIRKERKLADKAREEAVA
jgi:multiple sugar transport system permease protein